MVEDIERLWFGCDEGITATSGEVCGLAVVGAMTDSQTSAITTTIVAALLLLSLFFWIVEGRSALGVVAVRPIVMVLVCAPATMALAGIPYNLITALTRALGFEVMMFSSLTPFQQYGLVTAITMACADRGDRGGAAGDDPVGGVPELPGARSGRAAGSLVSRRRAGGGT